MKNLQIKKILLSLLLALACNLVFSSKTNQNNSWFSARMSLEITGGTEGKVSAFVVNKRDSIIYVHLSKFGIELSRAILTPEKLTFVNRFDKTYYKGDYSIIRTLYGLSLNYEMIQAIILGETITDSNVATSNINDTLIKFNSNDNSKGLISQEITYNETKNRILKNSITDFSTLQSADIMYNSYINISNYFFPNNYTVELPDLKINIESENIKVDVPGPTSLTIPEKYKPINKNGR